MLKTVFTLFGLIFMALSAYSFSTDTMKVVGLLGVEVLSTPKEQGSLRQQPTASSSVSNAEMQANQVTSLKNISAITPNFFIPEYGSRSTSAVYIRGIGSRINTPAVGLYVDNIPYVDKSAFDFNLYGVERIDVLRGPQGTLYGRNAMGGIVNVYTKNPFRYQGTDVNLAYNTGNHRRMASLTHYHLLSDNFSFSAGGYYEGVSGFFKNSTTGEKVDELSAAGGRFRAIYAPQSNLKFDLSGNYDYSDEGAYPYYYAGTVRGTEQYAGCIGQITNNRESGYRRSMANVGLNVEWNAGSVVLNSSTGYQHVKDRMFLDQDFLKADIYTLEQRQRINTITEELTVRNARNGKWQWLTGVSFMYQSLKTQAPVTFYADGLRWLETNINRSMPSFAAVPMMAGMGFSTMSVNFNGDNLPLDGVYSTPTLGLALYHQSTYNITDRFSATVGLRFDYEHRSMTYDSWADVPYGFTMPNAYSSMMAINLPNLESHLKYNGRLRNDQTRLLPRFSMKYAFDKTNSVYASVAMGQRSGGYNLQMFSDLMQSSLRGDMMQGVQQGVGDYLDRMAQHNPHMPQKLPQMVKSMMAEHMPVAGQPQSSQVVYKPEYSWNYEIGAHLQPANNLIVDAALFYTTIRDRQIARFVSSGMGRMMANAGKSRSYGGELSVRYSPISALQLTANYGYTNSKFTEYDDGSGNDCSGCYVPYVPKHTVNVDAAYTFQLKKEHLRALTLGVGYTGAGRIYWLEDNGAYQNYYQLLNARVALDMSFGQMTLWARNITDANYQTFYFQSMQRGFEQHGKPFHIGVDLKLHF